MTSNRWALLAAVALAAQPFGASADDLHKLEKIEVSGHYENSVGSSDAASEGAVTAKLIESRPILRPAELLEFVPGVIITQHSGDGKANQYFLRGFNLDHGTDFATSVAGMPVNMPTHAHGQGYTDLNFLIPELVERIEYRKGPYFAEEGDFASAGAAHIHLFDALPRGIAEVSLGENAYRRALLADSQALGPGRLLYAIEAGHNDGPWVNPENFRKWSGVLRWSEGSVSNGYSVTAMAYDAKWNATDQIPLRAVENGTLDRFGAVDPSDGGETSRYSLSFDFKRKSDATSFQASAYAIRSRLNLFSNFTYFLDNPVAGDQFEQAERRQVYGGSAAQSWRARWGEIDVTNQVGLQLRQDRLDPVALYSTVQRERIGTTREDRVRETSTGVFLENNLQWTEWLRSSAGLRYDQYSFRVDSSIPENSGSADDHIVSPKLSLVFGPWAKTEYFVNAGRGFHSNDARGVTTRVDPKTGEPTVPVTPLARSTGEEIGVRTELIPGLQSSLALWRLTLASELVFVGDAGTTEPSRPSLRRGVEWNNHYVFNPKLLVDLDLAASHARFTDDDPAGDYIPGAVDKVASFGVSVVDLGPWFGSFQLRYFGPRPLIEDNSQRSQSTTLAYLRTGYTFNRNAKLALDIFNLFDREASDIDYYYASRLPGEPADGVLDRHFHPVEKRTFRVTFTYNF
jgi:outer membrane receptor protein involved in Fe transport